MITNAETQLVSLPVVDAGNLGQFAVAMRLIGRDERWSPGLLFEVISATKATGDATATFSAASGLLDIPKILIDGDVFAATLTLVSRTGVLRFAVTALDPSLCTHLR
jgi:hypothetical protein